MTPHNHLFVPQTDDRVKSAISIDGHEVMPLAAVSKRLTLLCNEAGQWIRYRSDRHGFNNPAEIWQAERLEIAALGDSSLRLLRAGRPEFRGAHPTAPSATLNLGSRWRRPVTDGGDVQGIPAALQTKDRAVVLFRG